MGVSGLLPKAMISMYLSFFPVVVGMVKGLRSPDQMQLDQMRTWHASAGQTFWKLRLPASMPYFFTSLKIAMAASLVGAIIGELPTGAVAGLGAQTSSRRSSVATSKKRQQVLGDRRVEEEVLVPEDLVAAGARHIDGLHPLGHRQILAGFAQPR